MYVVQCGKCGVSMEVPEEDLVARHRSIKCRGCGEPLPPLKDLKPERPQRFNSREIGLGLIGLSAFPVALILGLSLLRAPDRESKRLGKIGIAWSGIGGILFFVLFFTVPSVRNFAVNVWTHVSGLYYFVRSR